MGLNAKIYLGICSLKLGGITLDSFGGTIFIDSSSTEAEMGSDEKKSLTSSLPLSWIAS